MVSEKNITDKKCFDLNSLCHDDSQYIANYEGTVAAMMI